MKKIGLFGGTFDPIHNGHLNLAFELMEKHLLNEVWFIPNQVNPLKSDNPPATLKDRMEMIQSAIHKIPQFILKDFENFLPIPSYTIDTIKCILDKDHGNRDEKKSYYLLLGEDSVFDFHKWHLSEEIVKLIPLLIASRSGKISSSLDHLNPIIQQAIRKGLTVTQMLDISSSLIRYRIKNSLYCQHLVDSQVFNYIQENHLYESK
ncbi:MAG: nicotinate (nicotinamide) nucleotide adenylyltransferase [Parachlamydiaceae bacterium]|nr:nicotinate (nicotinamide) nucleotide adenylyltransferase [Parachlamydiaceae bacterium]